MNFVLTERDKRIIQEAVSQVRNQLHNTANRPAVPDDLGWVPEVYIAKTGASGIPALVPAGAPGTDDSDEPGCAFCDLYMVTPSRDVGTGGEYELKPMTGQQRLVFNLSTTLIPANSWTRAIRDKWGTWLADPVGSGGGGEPDYSITVLGITNTTDQTSAGIKCFREGTAGSGSGSVPTIRVGSQDESGGSPAPPTQCLDVSYFIANLPEIGARQYTYAFFNLYDLGPFGTHTAGEYEGGFGVITTRLSEVLLAIYSRPGFVPDPAGDQTVARFVIVDQSSTPSSPFTYVGASSDGTTTAGLLFYGGIYYGLLGGGMTFDGGTY